MEQGCPNQMYWSQQQMQMMGCEAAAVSGQFCHAEQSDMSSQYANAFYMQQQVMEQVPQQQQQQVMDGVWVQQAACGAQDAAYHGNFNCQSPTAQLQQQGNDGWMQDKQQKKAAAQQILLRQQAWGEEMRRRHLASSQQLPVSKAVPSAEQWASQGRGQTPGIVLSTMSPVQDVVDPMNASEANRGGVGAGGAASQSYVHSSANPNSGRWSSCQGNYGQSQQQQLLQQQQQQQLQLQQSQVQHGQGALHNPQLASQFRQDQMGVSQQQQQQQLQQPHSVQGWQHQQQQQQMQQQPVQQQHQQLQLQQQPHQQPPPQQLQQHYQQQLQDQPHQSQRMQNRQQKQQQRQQLREQQREQQKQQQREQQKSQQRALQQREPREREQPRELKEARAPPANDPRKEDAASQGASSPGRRLREAWADLDANAALEADDDWLCGDGFLGGHLFDQEAHSATSSRRGSKDVSWPWADASTCATDATDVISPPGHDVHNGSTRPWEARAATSHGSGDNHRSNRESWVATRRRSSGGMKGREQQVAAAQHEASSSSNSRWEASGNPRANQRRATTGSKGSGGAPRSGGASAELGTEASAYSSWSQEEIESASAGWWHQSSSKSWSWRPVQGKVWRPLRMA